jgi:hypothetical protein
MTKLVHRPRAERRDNPMTSQAIVIEKAANGVIVRPHRDWYRAGGEESSMFSVEEVRVYATLPALAAALKEWFP